MTAEPLDGDTQDTIAQIAFHPRVAVYSDADCERVGRALGLNEDSIQAAIEITRAERDHVRRMLDSWPERCGAWVWRRDDAR